MFLIRGENVILILAVLMPVLSAPLAENEKEAQIEEYKYTNDGEGNYYFGFKTSNGIAREETGTLVNKGLPNEHISVEGSYIYTNPDGKPEMIVYKADENGFIKIVPPKSGEVIFISDGLLSSLIG